MHDTPREGASPCAGCRLFQRGEIARSTRSSRHPPPRTPRPARSPSSDAAAVARGAQASVQARRDARLRPPLRVLRLTTRVRACDARSRSSARQGRNPFAGQRRIGMPAVQSAESRHAACRVLSPPSVGGKQLHSVCARGASGAQASGATRGQSGIRRRASRVVPDSPVDAGRGRVRAALLPASAFGGQCLVTRRRLIRATSRGAQRLAASKTAVEILNHRDGLSIVDGPTRRRRRVAPSLEPGRRRHAISRGAVHGLGSPIGAAGAEHPSPMGRISP